MPTIHRENGLRYMIYSSDHTPAHVHVKGAGCECKVLLDPVSVARNAGFTSRQLSDIREVVRTRAREFEDEWNGIFGKPEG